MTSTTQNAKQGCKTSFEYFLRLGPLYKDSCCHLQAFSLPMQSAQVELGMEADAGASWPVPSLKPLGIFLCHSLLFVLSDLFVVCLCWKRISLCSAGRTPTWDLPVAVFQILGWLVWATMPSFLWHDHVNRLTILASICSRRKMEVVG